MKALLITALFFSCAPSFASSCNFDRARTLIIEQEVKILEGEIDRHGNLPSGYRPQRDSRQASKGYFNGAECRIEGKLIDAIENGYHEVPGSLPSEHGYYKFTVGCRNQNAARYLVNADTCRILKPRY